MKTIRWKKVSVAILSLLAAAMLLSACGQTEGNGKDTESASQSSSQSTVDESSTVEYTVYVKDYKGQAPTADVLVELMQGDTSVALKKIDKDGKVTFKQEKGNYTFTLQATKGEFYYDSAVCTLSADETEATVTVYDTSTKTTTLYPAFNDDNDERTEYEATMVKEGATLVKIDKNGKGFYVFRPERGGIYRFSYISDQPLTIGYFGHASAILATSVADPEQVAEGYFEYEVKNFSSDQLGISLNLVVGLTSDTVTEAILVVERVDDPIKGIPWTYPEATGIPASFPDTNGKTIYLTDISVTDPSVKIVKNDADGFYHYGTANGPIVYARINSDNPYTHAFAKMCETDILGKVFRENDVVVKKECYNNLFDAYAKICDNNGLCPLTDELIVAITNCGEQKGWWNFDSTTGNIFITDASGIETGINAGNFVKENAYLFACCYVAQ